MNVLSNYLTEQILLGENDSQLEPVVVYSGRFQPFHKGHYETYSHLVKKFGKNNVYIGTSNKVDKNKSPFNFNEKQKIMTTMFGIPKSKIVQIKNPYAPKEILEKFDPEKTAYITVVGEKDASRLGGKYFEKYSGELTQGYKDKGYVYVAPKGSDVSGTMVRNNLGNGSTDEKYDFFKNVAYPKFNKTIFDLVTSKLTEGFVFDKEVIEDWVLNEATQNSTGQDDDGPASFHPNYDVYAKISAERARKIGYEVINMITMKKFDDYYEHPDYPNGPVKAVSFYPAGVIGAMTPNNQIDIYSNGAYAKWYQHATRKATLCGYELVHTQIERDAAKRIRNLSTSGARDIEDEFEKILGEAITIPVEVGDIIKTGKFKNKKTVVKTIGKDEHGMPTINGKKVVTFRLYKKGPNIFDNIVEFEDVNETNLDVKMANLGILRKDMPQIHSTNVRDFLSYLKNKGITHDVRKIPVKHLKLTQRDINPGKVEKMMGAPYSVLTKPVLSSIDKYILDGHHRLLALYNKDKNSKLPSVRINAPIKDLLKHAKSYPKVSYKGINEMLKEGNDKLKLSIPPNIKKLHKAFKKHGKKLYVVGGAVRDAILGKTPKDYDLATDAKPDEVIEIAEKEGLSVAEVGKQFGVVIVNGDEIATFRKDVGKGRRPTSVDYTDIEGDVRRRDLTINALFYDIDRGEIVDLVGGIKDLQDKKIRTVGKAEERFDEDPLRKLRALRFHARVGGTMDKEIMNALKNDPSLKGVSTERIRDEFVKGIKSAKSPKSYLELAEKLGLLKIILPNLKISKPYVDENDPIVLLAYILRNNDVNTLRKQLNKLKYTNEEVKGISFLVSLNDFNNKEINKYKKAQSVSKLSDEQIINYGKLINKDLKKFVKFKTSVKGGDAPKELKGKEIQNWIDNEERKRYINEARKRDINKAEYRKEISKLKKYIENNNSGEKKITPEAAKLMYNNIISIGFDNNHIPEGTKNKLYNHNAVSFKPYFSSTYDDITKGLTILSNGLGNGDAVSINENINEMNKPELRSVEKYADKQLDPTDVAFTKHFFDRLNDPRNKKEITPAELTGFFKRLSKYKKRFKDFLSKYKEIVVKDARTKINIPFVNMVNQIIAKTIMRKPDFKTNTPVYAMEIKTLHEIQKHTKSLMNEDKIPGGLADKVTLYDIANKHNVDIDQLIPQLQKGIKVELEHTDDRKVAEEIALDHLFELPDYYDRLEKVEEVLAENLNNKFEKLINEDKLPGGEADKYSIKDIAKKHNVSVDQIKDQLRIGIKVEYEHTNDPMISAEIAKDHLVELPDYYDRLDAMEKRGKTELGITEIDEAKFRNDVATKPKTWYKLDTKDVLKISGNIVDLVQTAYKNAPDGSYVNSKSDLKRSIFWNAIDVDDDFDADAVLFGRKSPQGIKIQGIGHDGDAKSKAEVIKQLVKVLKKPGYWVEASDALEKVLYKTGVPYVKSENVVNSIFPGSDAKMTGNKGQYTRKLENGKKVTETTFGNPKVSVKEHIDKKFELLMEGGAYGHMNHPFDTDVNLTFGQLKDIANKALDGELKFTREKTDGQALAVSWKNGQLIAARNKGHLKNKGENALSISEVAKKFANRGGLTDAYNFAMRDLQKAIGKLSKKQRDKIFNNGGSFMNLEVIHPKSVNVIPYGQPLLVFHGTMDYDDDGNAIGQNTEAGRMLAGMIKQINQDVQDVYTIQGPPVVELPKNKNLKSKKSKYLKEISKLQKEFGLKDSDGVAMYHQKWWENYIEDNAPKKLDKDVKEGLVKRWAFGDKSFRLNDKNINDKDVQRWAAGVDKQDQKNIAKNNLMKFEDIFLGIGADVLEFTKSVLTVNPDEAIRKMKEKIDKTIKDVEKSGDPKKLEKLQLELRRLDAIGGIDKLVPNEGIVFEYEKDGELYTMKLTGAFASINQLNGLFF